MQSLSYLRCFIGFTFAFEIDHVQQGGERTESGGHSNSFGGARPANASLGAGHDSAWWAAFGFVTGRGLKTTGIDKSFLLYFANGNGFKQTHVVRLYSSILVFE